MKDSDRRLTPEWLLELARTVFAGPIGLDPFTEDDNPTQAEAFYTPTQDGLKTLWPTKPTWVNPMFSQLLDCVRCTLRHRAKNDAPCLVLTPTDPTTEYTRLLRTHAQADALLTRRVRCIDPETGQAKDVARACTVWFVGGTAHYGRAFERAFQSDGHWVRPC